MSQNNQKEQENFYEKTIRVSTVIPKRETLNSSVMEEFFSSEICNVGGLLWYDFLHFKYNFLHFKGR